MRSRSSCAGRCSSSPATSDRKWRGPSVAVLGAPLLTLVLACSSAAPTDSPVPTAASPTAIPSTAASIVPPSPTPSPSSATHSPVVTAVAVTPTPAPAATPTAASTPSPHPTPIPVPTECCAVTPSPVPTVEPSPSSSPEVTPAPTPEPTPEPSPSPTAAVATVLAGAGTDDPGDGGPATAAKLRHPSGIAVGPDGTIWIVDNNAYVLRSITTDGIIHTSARGFVGPQGDAVSPSGTVYVADRGSYAVYRIGAKGKLILFAGQALRSGFGGDGGLAKRAFLSQPYDVATDAAGNVYIADTANQRIREVDAKSGKIRTIAGSGQRDFSGDGGLATDAALNEPNAVAVNAAGTVLYIADYGNARLRRVDLVTGIITTVAGSGGSGGSYDPALTGIQTPLNRIQEIALDAAGNAYLPVFYNNLGTLVMRLDPAGNMTRIAGGGTSPDADVPALDLQLPSIEALEIDPFTGALLIGVQDGRVFSIPGVAQGQ